MHLSPNILTSDVPLQQKPKKTEVKQIILFNYTNSKMFYYMLMILYCTFYSHLVI